MAADGGMGHATKRREDVRFLTGRGKYTDDYTPARTAYCAFARSIVANGKINSIDTDAAAEMLGVVAVVTGEDFAEVGGTLPVG